jgi:hypothetical protein
MAHKLRNQSNASPLICVEKRHFPEASGRVETTWRSVRSPEHRTPQVPEIDPLETLYVRLRNTDKRLHLNNLPQILMTCPHSDRCGGSVGGLT